MQPHEFDALIRGYLRREKARDYKKAYFTAWLISPHVKKPIGAETIADPLWVTEQEKQKQAEKDRRILRAEFGLSERG